MATPGRSSYLISLAALASLVLLAASEATAQGPFRWKFSPFCNVVTLNAVSQGSVFDLSGSDDNCGGPARSGATGIAFVNPDGTISMSLTVIGSNGIPRDVTMQLDPTLSGTWRDASGNTGTFVFNPGTVTGLPLPAAVLPAGPAGPAGPQGPPGPAVLTIFDAAQRKVGDVVSLGRNPFNFGGSLAEPTVILRAGNNGPVFAVRVRPGDLGGTDAFVFYASNDCSGPGLIRASASGLLAATAVPSGLVVLVADTAGGVSMVDANSFRQDGEPCRDDLSPPIPVHQTITVDLGAQFTPPFTIRLAAP